MALDPRDPELGKKIEQMFSDRDEHASDPAPKQGAKRDVPEYKPEDSPRVVRPFDDVQREQDDRLAETRRRRDLGREGRDYEREHGRGSADQPQPPTQDQQQPSAQNQHLTDYERRSLEFLESIDAKLSELGTLQ